MQAHPLTSFLLAFSSPFLLSPSTFVLPLPRPGAPPRDSPLHHARNRNSHHGGQAQQQDRNNSMGDCHSTLQHSRQQQHNSESEPPSSSSAHPRPESSPADVAAAWVLPPIPTFEELGLRFDRSRTSSMNAITEGGRLRAESQQQIQMQDIHRGVTNALLQTERSRDKGVFESRPGYPWSSSVHANAAFSGDDNVVVMPDMIPDDHHPSIFDDILSDDNEAYIIWSTPSTKTKPSLSSSTAGPSSSGGVAPLSVAVLLEPVKQHPAGSDASSASAAATTTQQQQHYHSSSSDKGTTSAGQDRSQKKRWSTIEPLNVRIKEVNQSTDTLQLSLSQPKPVKQESSSNTPTTTATGSNLRPPKTATTATTPNITTTTELQQKNRVIMAATAEKLVEKLTSEIGKFIKVRRRKMSRSPAVPTFVSGSYYFFSPFRSLNASLLFVCSLILIHLVFFF